MENKLYINTPWHLVKRLEHNELKSMVSAKENMLLCIMSIYIWLILYSWSNDLSGNIKLYSSYFIPFGLFMQQCLYF